MEKSTTNTVKTSVLKAGAKTFFFDVNVASNDKRYLKITESRFSGEGKDRVRNSVVVFPEQIQEFAQNLKEMAGLLN